VFGEFYVRPYGYYYDHVLHALVAVDGRTPLGRIAPSPIGSIDRHP
jgi:hypothetical protein